MKISIGDKNVLESGSIIVYGSDPIIFTLKDVTDPPLRAKLVFENNPNEKPSRIVSEVSGNELHLKLINFNNPIGSGTKALVPAASTDTDQIYLGFWVTGGSGVKVMHYTWAVGKKANAAAAPAAQEAKKA